MLHHQQIKILGSMCYVEYTVCLAEPDVGIMRPYVGEATIVYGDGKRDDITEDRITGSQWADILHELMEGHDA